VGEHGGVGIDAVEVDAAVDVCELIGGQCRDVVACCVEHGGGDLLAEEKRVGEDANQEVFVADRGGDVVGGCGGDGEAVGHFEGDAAGAVQDLLVPFVDVWEVSAKGA